MPDTKGWGGPRRYKPGADGELHRTWNGKLPEEFTPADTFSFMADTDIQLHGKVSADTLAAIHAAGYDYQGGAVVPMPGKENRNMSKDVILTPEQIAAEEKRWLFEVPIAELAEVKGVSIDEAVQMRIDANLQNAAPKLEVSARPITPMGNLLGFASVKINDCFVVEDFKILQTAKGLYVGMPSKPDKSSQTGYRETAKPITADFRKQLHGAILEAYGKEIEKLQARVDAARQPAEKQSIKGQLEQGAKQAAKEKASRPPKGEARQRGGTMMYQAPEKSPWGKVQTCDVLAPGVFLVSTASHGGTMVSKEVAAFLSPAAKRCGFKRNGFVCFEEDSQESVVLRELLDKKLWQIPERIKDKAAFEEGINQSIRQYNPEYWRARQSGLEAAKAARREAPARQTER